MQVTLGDKVYTSNSVTMGTLMKILKLEKTIKEREELTLSNDKEALAKLIETANQVEEIDKNVELIVEYFGNQFTKEDFYNLKTFNSILEFHQFMMVIVFDAMYSTDFGNGDSEKK